MSKTLYSKTFNDKFEEFINNIIPLLPNNDDISKTLVKFNLIKKINQTIFIKLWHQYVSKYYNIINNGNIASFLDKDFTEDVMHLPPNDATQILLMIDNSIRNPMKQLSGEDFNMCANYVQLLCKLADAYSKII